MSAVLKSKHFEDLPVATRAEIQSLVVRFFSNIFRVQNDQVNHLVHGYSHGYVVVDEYAFNPGQFQWLLVDSSGDEDRLVASGSTMFKTIISSHYHENYRS